MRHIVWLTLVAFLVGACAADPALTPAVEPADPPETAMPTATPPADPGATEPALDFEERARFALATGLDIAPGTVRVVSTERVDWPDAGLGCPQPGLAYSQVITPGYRLTLQSGDETYTVHTDLEGRAVVCTVEGIPAFPSIPVTPGEIDDGQPWMPVD